MPDKKTQLKRLERKLSNSLQEQSNSWIGVGIGFYKISQLIDKDNDQSNEWKKATGYPSFSKYVENKWGFEYPQKGFKLRLAAKNLLDNKPDLVDEYKSKRHTKLPGFTILYLLESKRTAINYKKWKSIMEKVYSGDLTRQELEEMFAKEETINSKLQTPKKKVKSTQNKSSNSPYEYFHENFNDEESMDEYQKRESFLLKEIPRLKDKVEELFPGEHGEELHELINLFQDKLKAFMFAKKVA